MWSVTGVPERNKIHVGQVFGVDFQGLGRMSFEMNRQYYAP
jgi:hypothetical protein